VVSLRHIQAGDTAIPGAFIRELAKRAPQHEEVLMTIAQKLEQQGIKKGRLEGRQEGEREATLKIARSMLASGLDRTLVTELTGLSAEVLAKIHH
jgi:predicted transposase/invertase (TIGR01784 family)